METEKWIRKNVNANGNAATKMKLLKTEENNPQKPKPWKMTTAKDSNDVRM